jgi:predicted ester cyclase
MVADEDTVWVNLTFEGTHEGELFGIPGTGHRISWHETDVFRSVDGMVRFLRAATRSCGAHRAM